MGGLKASIKAIIRKEAFRPGLIGLFFNPFFLIRRALYRTLLVFSGSVEGRVLDFGCGSKPYESLFKGAVEYVGMDLRVSGHNHAESKVDVFYDGTLFPLKASSFDVIVSFEVLEHVFNPDVVLDECRRVLRSGGSFLLTTPFAWDEHEKPYDYARYTSFGMKHLLEKHGFEVLAQEKTTGWFLAIAQIFIAAFHQRFRPRYPIVGHLFQLVFIFPMTLMALVVNLIMPQSQDYYCNLVTLAVRREPGEG